MSCRVAGNKGLPTSRFLLTKLITWKPNYF